MDDTNRIFKPYLICSFLINNERFCFIGQDILSEITPCSELHPDNYSKEDKSGTPFFFSWDGLYREIPYFGKTFFPLLLYQLSHSRSSSNEKTCILVCSSLPAQLFRTR